MYAAINSQYIYLTMILSVFKHTLPISPYLLKISALLSSTVNIILLLVILYIYVGRYSSVKSKITSSMIIFSLLFLMQNFLFAVYFLFNLPISLGAAMGPLLFLSFELVVWIVFLKVTLNEK